MKRREFLQKAGIGSAALASLPTVVKTLAVPAWGSGGRNFSFTVVSTVPSTPHRIILNGAGKVSSSEVEGGGSFTHFLAGVPSTGPPFAVVASGTWEAEDLLSFVDGGTYGAHAAGRLVMEVELEPAGGDEISATMTVHCNVSPAGLFLDASGSLVPAGSAAAEGVTLAIPGALTFTPLVGNTVFSTGED